MFSNRFDSVDNVSFFNKKRNRKIKLEFHGIEVHARILSATTVDLEGIVTLMEFTLKRVAWKNGIVRYKCNTASRGIFHESFVRISSTRQPLNALQDELDLPPEHSPVTRTTETEEIPLPVLLHEQRNRFFVFS